MRDKFFFVVLLLVSALVLPVTGMFAEPARETASGGGGG
jgi:hypothetical protein